MCVPAPAIIGFGWPFSGLCWVHSWKPNSALWWTSKLWLEGGRDQVMNLTDFAFPSLCEIETRTISRSSWLNCASQCDQVWEAMVLVGTWWYWIQSRVVLIDSWLCWVSKGRLCLYIMKKGEKWRFSWVSPIPNRRTKRSKCTVK